MMYPKTPAIRRHAGRAGGTVAAALAMLAACGVRPAAAQPPASAPTLQVATAAAVPWPSTVTVPGTVSAVDVAVLASRAGGWVTQVTVQAGSQVTRDTPLVAVGLPAAQAELAAAQARASAAQATLNEAAADQHRFSVLQRSHATSQRQYDAAERAFVTARAELAAARSALAAARNNLGYAEIRAPFDGTVVSKNVWPGGFAAPGAPLLTIAGTTPEIRAQVGPDTYAALKTGETAEVDIDGATEPAMVTRVVAAADPASRTHLVELRLAHGTTAPYGAFAEVRFTLGRHSQVTIPEAALTRRAGLRGVFVVDRTSHAQFRLVRTGATHDGRVAVVAGLAPGESVVLTPPPTLVGNDPVRTATRVSGTLSKEPSRD